MYKGNFHFYNFVKVYCMEFEGIYHYVKVYHSEYVDSTTVRIANNQRQQISKPLKHGVINVSLPHN